MGNCFVTKLKGVVNNDNLEKLGELTVKVASQGGIYMRISSTTAQTVKFVDPNGNIVDTISLPAQTGDAYTEVSKADISSYAYLLMKFENKYAVKSIETWAGYSTGDISATYEFVNGNITVLPELKSCSVNYDYTENPEYDYPELMYFSPSKSKLNFEAFSKCTKLVNQAFGSAYESYLYGNLAKFFADMCKTGRVSGTYDLTVNANLGTLKWNNDELSIGWTIHISFSSTGCTVTSEGNFPYATATYNKGTDSWTYNS